MQQGGNIVMVKSKIIFEKVLNNIIDIRAEKYM